MTDETKAFPEEAFADLIRAGFHRPRQVLWTQLRDQMIALLMHGGGLRLSETLHTWIPDVFEDPFDPDIALVRVYHPSEGLVPYRDPDTGRERLITRSRYLRLVHDRVPLTDLLGRKAVGWKSPLLTDSEEKFMHVFWRSSEYGRVFMRLYRTYVQIRPRVKSHPYLFIATSNEPMTVKGYEKVHAAAVRRIGLEPAKRLGTTPHGHRHAYGMWMRRADIEPKILQVAMHHKSVISQEIYTQADIHEILTTLAALEGVSELALPDLGEI
jgi:site-specific recombinase XerD